MRSIIQPERDYCYICAEVYQRYYWEGLEEHHVFFGPNRKNSERHGMKVYLCPQHHREGDMAVHSNRITDIWLKERAQRKYEETHTRKEFTDIFGRSWL